MSELLPCPFCGGDAELDTLRGYRNYLNGNHETAISVYCTKCSVEMMICYSDVPDATSEMLTEMWNRRIEQAPQPPLPAGSGEIEDIELPGMWERSDFTGGQADCCESTAQSSAVACPFGDTLGLDGLGGSSVRKEEE